MGELVRSDCVTEAARKSGLLVWVVTVEVTNALFFDRALIKLMPFLLILLIRGLGTTASEVLGSD